ncbi:BglG family transcription antiterminator [Helcococcus massiliensis]|uniref:BglG family transcription antiterminator n=1 Tax=Helcococcus massiliensis TaxID=2040290 RepID=UPI000CDE8CFC|nr:BglG family transcription antiterminator [Helcococcus massiliensis]
MIQRQKNIVIDLIDHPMSIYEISDKQEVTERTIRSDIKRINYVLEKYSAEICRDDEQNYYLNIKDKIIFQKFEKEILLNFNFDFSEPDMRVMYIILKFLFTDGYIKQDDLADEMFISKSTLKNDMKKVKNEIKKFYLSFDFIPNYGMKIVGSEKNIRSCISNLIAEMNKDRVLKTSNSIESLFDADILDSIYDIVVKNINESKISLSDAALNNLIIHIAIAIKRINLNQYFENKIKYDLNSSLENDIARKIIKDIEEEFDVEFPNDEITYITMHLMGTKLVVKDNYSAITVNKEEQEIIDLAIEMLDVVSEGIQYDLTQDKELLEALISHLKPAIYRFNNGLNIRNPLLDSIKENYPKAFNAAINAAVIVKKKLEIDFNEDEIGYLAIHIGTAIERVKLKSKPIKTLVVCTTGLGTSKLLQYKLEHRFKDDLEIVGATELYNLISYTKDDIELIISTVPFSYQRDGLFPIETSYIYIKDILGESGFEDIEKFIEKKKNKLSTSFVKNEDYLSDDLDYLSIDDIYVGKDFKNKEEVIKFISDEIIKKGKAPESIEELILKRESIVATSFGNLVAIPHPFEAVTENTFLSVVTLENPIEWTGNLVQLVILLNVKKGSEADYEDMYKKLLYLIDSEDNVKRIIDASNSKKILSIFKEIKT